MSTPANETFQIEDGAPSKPSGMNWKSAFNPLASLKISVALFALSIVLVLAGTLAQVEKDIWDVVNEIFRCWVFWLDARTFHPLFAPYVDIKGLPTWVGFYFPGGYTIGLAMLINLLAAHTLRFTVQAKGMRLVAGVIVTLLGILVTWLVIDSGHADSGLQDAAVQWDILWTSLEAGLFVLGCVNAVGIGLAVKHKKPEAVPLAICLAGLVTGLVLMFLQEGRGIDDSGMRILWQLIKGTAAGSVLLAGSILLFKKRAGVVVLHAGVVLMLIHEPIVGTMHKETQMRIDEGKAVNYAEDIRTVELAFIDTSNADFDEVVTIPRAMLLKAAAATSPDQQVISHESLPFDVKVLKFLKNSRPDEPKADEKNMATAGVGLAVVANEVSAGSGTDSDGAVDLTSAYVTLLDKKSKAELGTYLVGVYFNLINRPEWQPNRIVHEGATWDIGLRFERTYKPYSVKLIDVSKTDYAGTETPRDYRSIVRVVQPASGDQKAVDFEKPIWMNNPMRFAGETFYQTSYSPPDPRTGKEQTTLSVVRNTGWMIPYVACMIVAVGMLAHFWIIFVRFVSRRAGGNALSLKTVFNPLAELLLGAEPTTVAPKLGSNNGEASGWARAFPFVVAAVVGLFLLSRSKIPQISNHEPDYRAFGNLPVLYEGRLQPFDTLARNSLKLISTYQTFRDENGKKQPASLWLLDVIANPKAAAQHRVFRIDHPELIEKLKLDPKRSGFRYSLDEFQENLATLAKDAAAAREKQAKFRSADERKVLELERRLGVLDLLTKSFSPTDVRAEQWKEDLRLALRDLQMLDRRQPPRSVPPQVGGDEKMIDTEGWETFARGWTQSFVSVNLLGRKPSEPVEIFTEILVAHARTRQAQVQLADAKAGKGGTREEALRSLETNAEIFNKKIAEYRRWLVNNPPADFDLDKTSFESWFNHYDAFYYSMWCYVVAFLMALLSFIGWNKPLNRAAFLTIAVTFVVHSIALGARVYISGRPPVTNLYSSAVFIGWGALILAMIYEGVARMGIGNLIGSAMGAASLGISGVLGAEGDTIKVMQAVLDTQFWLWTHVTCITLGYAVTFVAGFAGLLYVIGGVSSKLLNPVFEKHLNQIIYGTVCFGIFFSFVGTVLGGLWADDSWGRFWGWDPKENGALIIVLWNALVMHARWDGMVKARGFAVLAIIGNIVTSWSWFGVNELSVGLHSYGFTEGMWFALWLFWISQAICVGVGLIPLAKWHSFRNRAPDIDASQRPETAIA